MKPTITLILSLLFLTFIVHSIWNLIGIFRAPTCQDNDVCYSYLINRKPKLELHTYLTDSSRSNQVTPLMQMYNFNYNEVFEKELTIQIPEVTRRNGSLFIHVVIFPSRPNPKPISLRDALYISDTVYIKRHLTQYAVPKSYTFNLLKDESKRVSVKPVSHLKTKFAIMMCTDKLYISQKSVPMEIVGLIRLNDQMSFLPLVQQDFLQTRLKDLEEIKSDAEMMTFTFSYAPSSIGKLRFLLQIESTLSQFITLGFTEKDLDEIKGVFADTNLYLLCATILIGSIHLLFDFLSFKNDVSFWKSNNSMAGLSTRTVMWRAFSQTVVFLFLLDEGTSLLVLIPSGIATIIEFWKVKKVLKAGITWRNGIPRLCLNKRKTESAEEARTRQYDEECMTYLIYLLYPLCVGAAVYSLLYQPHKSWYSWTINSLVNGVYAFGFLFMLPQLFVNYRLKSVAALPWRAFMYRAFNTFIDDVFAFIITMPTAHRVACFRDDVVFVIYLYQRWLYPVDKTRVDDSSAIDASEVVESKKEK